MYIAIFKEKKILFLIYLYGEITLLYCEITTK